MLTKIQRELSPSKVKPSFHGASIFARSQWQRPDAPVTSIYFVIFRGFMSFAMIVIVCVSLSDVGRGPVPPKEGGNLTIQERVAHYFKWFAFLTNWGLMLDTAQFIVGFIIVVRRRKIEVKPETQLNGIEKSIDNKAIQEKQTSPTKGDVTSNPPGQTPSDQDTLPIRENMLCAVYWIANTIAVDVAIGITCTYWVTVYNPKEDDLDSLNMLGHVVNSAFMLVDVLVNSHPFRVMHVVWPTLFVLVFQLYSVLYWATGGTDRLYRPFLYAILDWSKPLKSSIVCLLGLLFVAFVHFVMCLVVFIRRLIARAIFSRTATDHKMVTNGGVHLTTLPA